MINQLLVFLFFITFLFFPLVSDLQLAPNQNKQNIFSNKNFYFNNNKIQSHLQLTDIIAKVSSSVVGISVINNSITPIFEMNNGVFVPYQKNNSITTLGSGLIYSNNGYVITNTHVVKDAKQIFVTLVGGEKFEAELIGFDHLTDIALLKVNTNELPVSQLGDSNNLKIGEWVIALGNPFGLFDLSYQPTATIGIISGLNIDFGLKENNYVYKDMIQTDASIHDGNSGGPLINIFGEVIGVNTFIMTNFNSNNSSSSLAFSIPINRVKDIIHDLILYGQVQRNYSTGLKLKPINLNVKNYLNIPFNGGVVIIDVEKKSSAMSAGLKVGDIIFKVDDIIVNSNQDFININNENLRKSGDIITLDIWRLGVFDTVKLELKNYE